MAEVGGQGAKWTGGARSPAPGSTDAAGAPLEPASDLQSLALHWLERLSVEVRADLGAVWARDGEDALQALASRGVVSAPTEAHFEALSRAEGPIDLGAPETPASLRGPGRDGLSAATPLRAPDGTTLGALWTGGPHDPPGRVRPRTLAALGAAAEVLGSALGAERAAARLRALDEHVRRLDRLAALGELVAEIVHEIRNPLVSVKTFLQLLPERADDPAFREEFHAVAADELRRVERLLDVVLTQAQPERSGGGGASGSLRDAAESVLQLVSHRATQADVELRIDSPTGPGPRAALSEDALRQVLLNLVMNAIDACPAKGTVRVTLEEGDDGIILRVEDDGTGVPLELRERVFEPFFSGRSDRPGGLGLAISKRVVEEAGGQIEAIQTLAGGGCFRVRLPRA
ncbi:MAG: ATP-binding protein [Myxococcales bacterium]|nr:ATP-binding protein [Myxococcales bacterium]